MSTDRARLIQIIKSWSQSHDFNFSIASEEEGDTGIDLTSAHFSWLIKNHDANINLLDLLNRLDTYLSSHSLNKNDGCYCVSCGEYYHMAEPNQIDGSLICYRCRTNPYI